MSFSSPEKISTRHAISEFDCGNHDLNRFLKKHAYINQVSSNSTTYVSCHDNKVAGYYTITLASISHKQVPRKVAEEQPRYPIPVILLARLAADLKYQGRGLGKGLLKDAILRAVMVSDIAGCRALLVHAKDDQARTWYQQFGLEPSPTDPLHLMILLKDLIQTREQK